MLLLSSFILASLSLLVSAATLWCFVRVRKQLLGASTRSLAQLSTEVGELTSAFESLTAQQRRLSARVGMREVRHKGEQSREEESSSELPAAGVGDKLMPRAKLKEIARARGYNVS